MPHDAPSSSACTSRPGRRHPRHLVAIALGVGLAISTPALVAHGGPLTASVAQAATVVGLWTGNPVPAVPVVNESAALEVGTRFTSDVDGVVNGARFYKGPGNDGRHTAHLWDSAGRLLASSTFTGESASGWQSVSFATPVRIKRGQAYTVSYYASVGRFSVNKGYFTAPRRSGPLTTGVDAGVFRYGTSGYPTSTYGASNYWVDVRFTADAGVVTPAPSPTASPTTSPTAPPTVSPTAPPTVSPTVLPTVPAPVAGSRDKYEWPFASTSIWNMPIGSSAAYKPLGLTPPMTAYGTDEVYLPFDPTAPLRTLVDRGYWYPWKSGTSVPGASTGTSVRIPDGWIVPPPGQTQYPNRASAALLPSGEALEFQYTVRPTGTSNLSIFEGVRARYDLAGSGLTGNLNGNNGFGAHGGSGMTGIGGTIRDGELSGPNAIRHVLAHTFNMRKWGTKQGGNITNGFRWPAIATDNSYLGTSAYPGYGEVTGTGGSSKDGLGMGTLLAIPASVDLSTLNFETTQGAKLAWTHQNYGAYVVDDSTDTGSWDVHRLNVEIGVLDEFPAIDTYPGTNSPFGRDMNKIFTRLAVVDNNGPGSVGGGGSPRQPLAPALRN